MKLQNWSLVKAWALIASTNSITESFHMSPLKYPCHRITDAIAKDTLIVPKTQQKYSKFMSLQPHRMTGENEDLLLSREGQKNNIPQRGTNDTIKISSVGRAVQSDGELVLSAASESVLAIDPSTIEIIPFSKLSEEGQVLGGGYSGSGLGSKIPKSTFSFVNMFRGSANYIANHRNTIVVFHIPGELLTWDGFPDLMDDISLCWLLGMKPVIVVGCRDQVDNRILNSAEECELRVRSLTPDGKQIECDETEAGFESVRITDLDTLRIVKEEAGYVRFEVERQLGRSLYKHGLMDSDTKEGNIVSGNFYSAQPYGVIDGLDFKYTGFPRRVETEKIKQVLDAHDVVLMTSLGSSPSGEIFNVNTEHLASFVAGALGATKAIFFTTNEIAFLEKENKKLVQNLRVSDARNVLRYNNVSVNKAKGFIHFEDNDGDLSEATKEAFVKLGWCVASLERGVKRAHIISPINGALLQELYTRDGSGTLISRDIYEGIRVANVGDVAGIYDLIEPLVSAGTLVPRPKNVLENEINSYYVFTRDNLIVACAQIKLFEMGFAEIGCLVVKKEYRSQGRGDAMLGYLERLSVQVGCTNVFVLSTQTMEWFVERGFTEGMVDDLPPTRKAVYNHERKSKIYMKRIEDKRELDAAEMMWDK